MNSELPNSRTVWFLWLFILVLVLFIGEVYWSLLISKNEATLAAGNYQRRSHKARVQSTTPEIADVASEFQSTNIHETNPTRPTNEPATGSGDNQVAGRNLTTLPSLRSFGSSPIGTGSASPTGQQRIAVVDVDRILVSLLPEGYTKADLKNILPTIKSAVASVASRNHSFMVLNRSANSANATHIFYPAADWFDLTDEVLGELEQSKTQVTAR